MKINKHYISKIDQKLSEFDRTHVKSASQHAEISKHQRLYRLRDHPDALKNDLDEETFFKSTNTKGGSH